MITAEILADSVNPWNSRLTSFLLTYPRMIHSELMTHRVFSRNASSSRAIPLKKMIEAVLTNPAMPEFWGRNQRGMQAAEQLSPSEIVIARETWLRARDNAVESAQALGDFGVHKQIANRLLEPFSHITVLVTATEFENFFALRAHKDAQPEFMVLAFRMLYRYLRSTPKSLDWTEWHLPFGERVEGLDQGTKLKVVTARDARTSYLTFNGNSSIEEDIRLHDDLEVAGHWSPFEHLAQANCHAPKGESNFGAGWRQYRKMFHNENRTGVDLEAVLEAMPGWITLE